MYTLLNDLSAGIYNPNVAYNQSWIHVHNDANRALFSQAAYITNFDDLTISLSAGNVDIGAVEIKDWNSNLRVDVTTSNGLNALRVLSQDLESSVDDITIGDKSGKFATINSSYSALNVYPVVKNGGFKKCETILSGSPSFASKQILIYNPSNVDSFVYLTLTSGMSCKLPIGKKSESNHILLLDLEVLTIDNYNNCEVTFFS